MGYSFWKLAWEEGIPSPTFFSFLSIADTNVPLVFGIQLTDLTGLYIMLCSPHA